MTIDSEREGHCTLCQSAKLDFYARDLSREYLKCRSCNLIFVSPEYLLDPKTEKSRYDHHQNSPEDPHYRKFLGKLSQPLSEMLQPASFGLDFGCGPGPTLSVMLEEVGHRVALYDHFYFSDDSVWNVQYDFITATEVFEHLFSPGETLNRLRSCLKKGGVLGVMTRLAPREKKEFVNWYYKNDDTHVCFYSKATFEYLAEIWNMQVEFKGDNVILMRDKF